MEIARSQKIIFQIFLFLFVKIRFKIASYVRKPVKTVEICETRV